MGVHFHLIKNPFSLEYPEQVPGFWGKVAYQYHYRMYEMDQARGQVYGKFTQAFTEIGMLLLILDKIGMVAMPLWFIVLGTMGFILLVWVTGFIYLKLGLDKVRNIVTRNRDPMFIEIHERLNNGKRR